MLAKGSQNQSRLRLPNFGRRLIGSAHHPPHFASRILLAIGAELKSNQQILWAVMPIRLFCFHLHRGPSFSYWWNRGRDLWTCFIHLFDGLNNCSISRWQQFQPMVPKTVKDFLWIPWIHNSSTRMNMQNSTNIYDNDNIVLSPYLLLTYCNF